MKITEVELTPVNTLRIEEHQNVFERSLFYIVRVKTDEGAVGVGEMSDLLHHEPPDIEYLRRRINRELKGKDPFDLNDIEAYIQRFHFKEVREGLDIAIYDLIGKALKMPLYRLLGGKVRDRVTIAFPIWRIYSEKEIPSKIEVINQMIKDGVSAIRVYVGGNFEADKKLLRSIRDSFGYDLTIRSLDASCIPTPKKAIKMIKKFQKYEFMYFESPCPPLDFQGMAEVRKAVDIPISHHVSSLDYAMKLIENRCVDIFNISITCGGFFLAKKLFTLAEAANIECVVGTTQELNIGTAAQAHLIASTPNIHYPCDPAGPLVYKDDVTKSRIEYRNGQMIVPEGIGLGVEIDENKLKKLTVKPEDLNKLMKEEKTAIVTPDKRF